MNVSTYNTIANVTSTNNKFKYFNGTTWKTLTIGIGSYELTDLSNEIIRPMKNTTNRALLGRHIIIKPFKPTARFVTSTPV